MRSDPSHFKNPTERSTHPAPRSSRSDIYRYLFIDFNRLNNLYSRDKTNFQVFWGFGEKMGELV